MQNESWRVLPLHEGVILGGGFVQEGTPHQQDEGTDEGAGGGHLGSHAANFPSIWPRLMRSVMS